MEKKSFKERFSKYITIVVSVVIGLIVVFASISMNRSRAEALKEQEATIAELQNSINVLERTQTEATQKAMATATGLDTERVGLDKTRIDTFMGNIMSWKNYDEYTDVRTSLIEDYGVSPDSGVLTDFMPEVPNEVSNDGKTNYNRIDTYGIHISYDSSDIYNTGVLGDTYYYTVFAKWHTSDKNGSVGRSETIFTMAVKGNGTISDIYAFA